MTDIHWSNFKPPFGTQVDRGHPRVRGLKLCWLFNEQSGLRTFDAMGKYHGALTNDPTWGSGWINFDGGDDVVRASNWVANSTTETMAVLCRPPTTSQTNNFIVCQAPSTDNIPYRAINQNTSDYVRYINSDGGSAIAAIAINDDRWHMLIGTYDGTTGRIYVDGKLGGSDTFAASDLSIVDRFAVGRLDRSSPAAPWAGKIAAAWVWNRALTSAEVMEHTIAPYSIMQPIRRRVYSIAAAGGGTILKHMMQLAA